METLSGNLNVNLSAEVVAECYKEVMNWGHTIHQNICTGVEVIVPWGQMKYGVAIIVGILLLSLVVMLIGMVIMAIKESL